MNQSFLSLQALRRSFSHVLAFCVQQLFPDVQLVSPGLTEDGFYYDFVFSQEISADYLPVFEDKLKQVIRDQLPISKSEMMRENAVEYFKHHGQNLRASFLESQEDQTIYIFRLNKYIDFSPLFFAESTSDLSFFKLQTIQELELSLPFDCLRVTRIEGVAFLSKDDLKKHHKVQHKLKKYAHCKLADQMRLFRLHQRAGSLDCYWLSRGYLLRNILLDHWRKALQKEGFQEVSTPNFEQGEGVCKPFFLDKAKKRISGFPSLELEEKAFSLCAHKALHHFSVLSSEDPTYGNLPVRYAELVPCFQRNNFFQKRGLFGLENFHADISHVFCREHQVLAEVISSLKSMESFVKMFGFCFELYLRSQEKGHSKFSSYYEKFEKTFSQEAKEQGINFKKSKEHGKYFGPCLEFVIIDSLGRKWRGPFIGVDLIHSKALGCHDQKTHAQDTKLFVVKRSIFHSLEAFLALTLEHYLGSLPFFLAPEQVRILPLTQKNLFYAHHVCDRLIKEGLRASLGAASGDLSSRIYLGKKEKIPYLLIVGDREQASHQVSVRPLQGKETSCVGLDGFLEFCSQ